MTSVKTVEEVTAAKLRGGFYSPAALVRICLDRAAALLAGAGPIRALEPTAGDGAFVRGLAEHPLAERVTWTTAVEIVDTEASVARRRLDAAGLDGEVISGSFLLWALRPHAPYDLALGNPPFVRFQFVDATLRAETHSLAASLGLTLRGVSNLWQPVLLGAVAALRPGGVFAFIVPAEIFTGISGHDVREWLLSNVIGLHVDVFDARSFPQVLQEVVVISGRRRQDAETPHRTLAFHEHRLGGARRWQHEVAEAQRTWTRYLLTPAQLAHLDAAVAQTPVAQLGTVARFEVATVTGANAYFCVDDASVDEYGLAPWTRPLLPRTRHAAGLVFTEADHKDIASQGLRAHLLDFCAKRPDPTKNAGAQRYLEIGERSELPLRYKCRIRTPWYRVPVTSPGELLMAKRSHHFPRVVVNEATVVTTDTIYRGRMTVDSPMTARALAASFHNSLTLLSAEIEGRSLGGGVLELVPSEISRLSIPVAPRMSEQLDQLDQVCRDSGADSTALLDATDNTLVAHTPGLSHHLLAELRAAGETLRALRLSRN